MKAHSKGFNRKGLFSKDLNHICLTNTDRIFHTEPKRKNELIVKCFGVGNISIPLYIGNRRAMQILNYVSRQLF